MTTVLEHTGLDGLDDEQLAAAYFDPGADLDAIDAEHKHRAAIRSARRQANAARTRARSEPWRELAEPQYERAEAECSYLLNRRGIAAGMQPWPALWTGPWHNAEPYMSEELKRWFERPGNERITVTEYQRQESRAEKGIRR